MYSYYRDRDGREWGPFTAGQLTRLLNLEVLTPQSLVRTEGDDTWHSYYAQPQPKDWVDDSTLDLHESEQKRLRGDRIAAQLELHMARLRVEAERAGASPPAEWPHADFAEQALSLVYRGACEPVFEAGTGLKFGDGKNIAIELHLSSETEASTNWTEIIATLDELKRRQEAQAAAGKYRAAEFSPCVHLDVQSSSGAVRYAWTKFKHLHPPSDWQVEHLFVASIGSRLIHVHAIYPHYLEILVGSKVLRFLALTADEAARAL